MSIELNYDEWIHLDAEELAENGIAEAYNELLPELGKYVKRPARVEEVIDDDAPFYAVKCGGKEYVVYKPDDHHCESWERATRALFAIVNEQMAQSTHRFCAINGGNDLGGMFLTPDQAKEAQKALPNKKDWPYLPTDEDPLYGQYHE